MLSKNAFTYSKYIIIVYILHWDITEYPCRLQDMSRFQGVHIKGFYCTCLQFNVNGSCAEGLHFSALVGSSNTRLIMHLLTSDSKDCKTTFNTTEVHDIDITRMWSG